MVLTVISDHSHGFLLCVLYTSKCCVAFQSDKCPVKGHVDSISLKKLETLSCASFNLCASSFCHASHFRVAYVCILHSYHVQCYLING